MDRDAELVKIQVFADYCHTYFTFKILILTSAFIGLLIVALAIGICSSWFAFFLASILFFFVFPITYYESYKDYHANLDQIQVLLDKLEKNESLPTLKEMKKTAKGLSMRRLIKIMLSLSLLFILLFVLFLFTLFLFKPGPVPS